MKQILILYLCYFEPMSLWYTTFTRNARNGESWGNIIGSSLSLSRSHADSKERARRQYRARTPTVRHGRTQSQKGLCYSGPTTPNWFPDGAWSTRATGRDWPEKHTELIRGQNTRRQTADPSDRQLNLFINRHTWFIRFVESTESIRFDSIGGVYRQSILQI